ncbi:hypothetical protein BC829DRAFT_26521 [Chytridium lagenaria]|nr:hypothetical protein BC829DRAFT_26521 [Chytridium lagenaria]
MHVLDEMTGKGTALEQFSFVRHAEIIDPEEAYELGYTVAPHLLASIYNLSTWYVAFTNRDMGFYIFIVLDIFCDVVLKGVTNRIRRRKALMELKEVLGDSKMDDEGKTSENENWMPSVKVNAAVDQITDYSSVIKRLEHNASKPSEDALYESVLFLKPSPPHSRKSYLL